MIDYKKLPDRVKEWLDYQYGINSEQDLLDEKSGTGIEYDWVDAFYFGFLIEKGYKEFVDVAIFKLRDTERTDYPWLEKAIFCGNVVIEGDLVKVFHGLDIKDGLMPVFDKIPLCYPGSKYKTNEI